MESQDRRKIHQVLGASRQTSPPTDDSHNAGGLRSEP